VLDKSRYGCCSLVEKHYVEASGDTIDQEVNTIDQNGDKGASAAREAVLKYIKDGVYCWEGPDNGY
jgi:hypothetical protein